MNPLDDCYYSFGRPEVSGTIRTYPEDFFVDEQFAFDFTGEGEHVLLHIEKKDTNTEWLAKQIVKLADLRKMDVSYAGLKDRNAVTRQWFSAWLPHRNDPDWSLLNSDNVKVLDVLRHNRKLRRGSLSANRFRIVIRNLEGNLSGLAERLNYIAEKGVPNYFGEQRFGHNGMNLEKAEVMFRGQRIKDRFKRSMYLSAARSKIFNTILSERVKENCWNKAMPGDVMLLANSHSYFLAEEITDEISNRIKERDISPSASLWGKGDLLSQAKVREIEQNISEKYTLFATGLEDKGLKQERRALILPVSELDYKLETENNILSLSFSLPAGGYATSVLREVVNFITASNADKNESI